MAYVVTSPVTVQKLQRAAALAYQGQNAQALQFLHRNALSYDDLRSYLVATNGLGSIPATPVQAPAPAAAAVPVDTSTEPIANQLSQISVDWTTGTLYVGTNHYSLLTTFLGGLVIKGLFWGTGKITDRISTSFSSKPATAAKKNPFFAALLPKLAGGGAAAVGEHVTSKALKAHAKRHRRRT